MTKQPSGYELWRGPSRLDGMPIVALIKMMAVNTKTGPMASLYVLRQDMSPTMAVEAGADSSVCGNCPMRQALGGKCYVAVEKGPGRMWKAWRQTQIGKGSNYQRWAGSLKELASNMFIRLTAYGDIDALPRHIPETLAAHASMHTAYTEGWRGAPASWRTWCMASVHSAAEAAEAQGLGWRTYRDKAPDEAAIGRELLCRYQASKRRTRCMACRLCSGGVGRSIIIDRH